MEDLWIWVKSFTISFVLVGCFMLLIKNTVRKEIKKAREDKKNG
jgi:hypothetical protein